MNNLTISFIQADLTWENRNENLKKFELFFEKNSNADIMILPEMFNTGFSMNVKKNAEPFNGKTVIWMKQQAAKHNFVLTGSITVIENKKYYNRFIAAYPDGQIKHYDKRHLFRMGQENIKFSTGYKNIFFEVKGWKIRPLVCYDLRFPVWSRNTDNYDILIYVANWPKPRRKVWQTLLKARAIENQCYVVGVNRIGIDDNNLQYSGDSTAIDAKGNIITALPENSEDMVTFSISLDELKQFKEKFPVYLDADNFKIIDN
jgi:predicted amidohydrolase